MSTKRDSVGFQVYFECDSTKHSRMRQWVISRIKQACEASQYGPVIVVVLDENDREAGRNEIGAASKELKAMADEDEIDHVVARR